MFNCPAPAKSFIESYEIRAKNLIGLHQGILHRKKAPLSIQHDQEILKAVLILVPGKIERLPVLSDGLGQRTVADRCVSRSRSGKVAQPHFLLISLYGRLATPESGAPGTTVLLGRFFRRARYSMKQATREWVKKAENDFETAAALMRRKKILGDSICFHCQQCVEKYLKARLEEAGSTFGV